MSYHHCGLSNNLTFVDGGPEIFNTLDPIGSKILGIFREKDCGCSIQMEVQMDMDQIHLEAD